MNRSVYDYTLPPVSSYCTNRRAPQYERGYVGAAVEPPYSPPPPHAVLPHSNYADVYEGNNATTLRAEERHWYIENHKSLQNHCEPTDQRDVKEYKPEEKKGEAVGGGGGGAAVRAQRAERRDQDRCSCECWPSAEEAQAEGGGSISAVDMVASYGVYRNPQEDDSSGFVRITDKGSFRQHVDAQAQGVVVNQQGNSAVVRAAGAGAGPGAGGGGCGECCAWAGAGAGAEAGANSEDYCWIHYCRPALIIVLLLFFLVLLGVSTGFLLTNNYLHYEPRAPLAEEPCEKTFCRWGAECVPLGGGRAHCACPASCPSTPAPVCSTAGRTHRNQCLLRKEACERRINLRVKHDGECEASDPCRQLSCGAGGRCAVTDGRAECKCPRTCVRRKSVCGTDGLDYASACHLDKYACENQLNITVKYQGKCDPCAEHDCADGSECQLDAARAAVCRCGPPCEERGSPEAAAGAGGALCGSDYRDYAGECELRRESCRTRQQLTIAYRGECASAQHPCSSLTCGARERCSLDARGVAVCGCGPDCEPLVRPVCGSDGRTYDSPCALERAACLANKDLRLVYMGACGALSPCARASCPWGGACRVRAGAAECTCPSCDSTLAPVCGSDLNTYGSACKMRAHACNQGLRENELVVLYNGTCQTCVGRKCRGKGECILDAHTGVASCQCNHNCTDIQDEPVVCGTDGLTYDSECTLLTVACRDQTELAVAYKGDCSLCAGVECAYGAHCAAGECVCPADCSGAAGEPVCANTMHTYANECELQKAACGRQPQHSLHVIFVGDCKDRLAAVGPPIAMTTSAPPFTISELAAENSSSGAGTTEAAGEGARSTLQLSACRDIRCDYEASCELGADGYPRCSCLFRCPDEEYFPVCASDFNLYPSLCAMRREGCQKQVELRLRPLDLCKGMEVRPCGGNKAMVDSLTGLEIDCGSGPHRQDCPVGGYCHQTVVAARCCPKNESRPYEDKKTTCADSQYGCCADGVTAATGVDGSGCAAAGGGGCGCNRLGSLSERCLPDSGQCECRPGVGGLKCDRCEPGYWGLPRIGAGHAGCIPCGCSAFGSVREDCEQMTGRCVCRTGVQGQKCTVCADHRHRLGPAGCYDPENGGQANSCTDLVCYWGAVCVEGGAGRGASCHCVAAPCPDSDTSMLVCGSDGKTYSSECHLKLQACRTQEDIVVQAFGPCKAFDDPAGTAHPMRPYSPLQFTQQDDVNSASKSTRHLMNPDPRYYNKYEWAKKETPSDIDSLLQGQKNKGIQAPTPATIGAVGPLLGDLCSNDEDCAQLPGAYCSLGGCFCKPTYVPTLHRKGCTVSISFDETRLSTEEYSACLSEPCYNMGTCIDLPASTYTCVCSAFFTGPNCESVSRDVVGANYIETPSFDGTSYIRLKTLKAYHKLNIDIEFKTFSENGIILYNQQKADGTGDYVSLALINGYVEFKYNLGNGAVVLTSPEKVSLNEYHKVSAKRYHRDGILNVDDMEDVTGQSSGNLKALDLAEDAYIGSVPTNFTRVFENIGTRFGFAGCIKHMRLIRHQVTKKLGRPDPFISSMENVRECKYNPCVSIPCKNGATCKPIDDSATEYNCLCPQGFQGAHCDERLDPCESNPCGEDEGVLCDIGPQGEYVCRCLFGGEVGTNGNTCSNEVSVTQESVTPMFNGTSYIEHPVLEGFGKNFRLELWFLTNRLFGMLLYTGQSTKAKGDFIAINLVNGYLQFRFNLGSGIANITVGSRVTKGVWHRLRATRVGRHGTLQLDQLPVERGQSVQPHTHLDLQLPLFIGSLPSYIRAHKLSGVTSSFVGAMQQVFINGSPLQLYGATMPRCLVTPEEDFLPCATSGVSRYTGPPCTEGASPCKNNGTCVPLLNEYKCICKDGYQGRNCDVDVIVEIVNDDRPVKFAGDTYYAYRSRGSRRKRGDHGVRYEIKFRTFNESGLLMWRRKIGIRPRDFIGVGLTEGRLQLIYTDTDTKEESSRDDWFQSIESKDRVDDGMWHTVAVKRRKRLAMLQIDDQSPIRGYSQSILIPSKSNPKLWIGGSPSLPLGLPPSLYAGLEGCVASVKVSGRHVDVRAPIRPTAEMRYCE